MTWFDLVANTQEEARKPITVNGVYLGKNEPQEVFMQELAVFNQMFACYLDHLGVPLPNIPEAQPGREKGEKRK